MSRSTGARLLAVTSITLSSALREKLAPLDHDLTCVTTVGEITELRKSGEHFEVIILPERFADSDWWILWSELSSLDPPPAILVYSRNPTFRLWTAVLDLGGSGVISEPFEQREINQLVIEAALEFRARARSSTT
ncbi:MAG TPA: hypothetical protein VIM60_05155 [Edaphobacter sp.]